MTQADMKIKAIAPWFGGKRTLAPAIVRQLGKHTQYFEPCCGSMAVLLAKKPSQKETVNDMHGDLINLSRTVQCEDSAVALYNKLQTTPFSEDLLQCARVQLEGESVLTEILSERLATSHSVDRAYWYFLASWMGRNGTAGTERVDYQIAVRWTKNGGSPTVRFRNAVESIPEWHRRLLNVVILNRDMFRFIDRFEDVPGTAIYLDPPYMRETRSNGNPKAGGGGRYLHDFDDLDTKPKSAGGSLFGNDDEGEDDKHNQLAGILSQYRNARIVISYYDCERVRSLYKGWTFVEHSMNKQLHAQNGRGARQKEAPEVLIINGPSYTEAA